MSKNKFSPLISENNKHDDYVGVSLRYEAAEQTNGTSSIFAGVPTVSVKSHLFTLKLFINTFFCYMDILYLH